MGNNSWIHPPFFWRHLVPQNVGNIIFVCYFINIGLGPTKSQWSRHLFEKTIPGLFYSKPPRKVSATELELRPQNLKNRKINRPTCFQTLTFCRNLSFQKSWICPWIFQGFPTPWISHPMDFGFSGRPRERPTKTKIGRQGRISRLPEGSQRFSFLSKSGGEISRKNNKGVLERSWIK